MRSNIALIAVVSLALLFGCAGSSVPQEKYDALAASCSKAKNESAASLSSQIAKTNDANSQLSSCTAQRQSLEAAQSVMERQNSELQAQADVLAAARVKTDMMGQYALAQQYYLDAYGPDKIINSARLRRIEAQVALLGDAGLSTAWYNVRDCQTITECGTAKAKFLPYISNRTNELAVEVAAIVGANATSQ